MSRLLCTAAVVCSLLPSAQASKMQFAVGGVPIGPDEVVEVETGEELTVGIYIEPDPGIPFYDWYAEFYATGPWVDPEPLPKMEDLVARGEIWMLGVWRGDGAIANWDNQYDFWWAASLSQYPATISPQTVAEFNVDFSNYPVSTMLNLEFGYAEIGWYEVDTTYPLILHVTPEPATLCLLALGGLAVLWRQRQGAMSLP